MQSNLTIAPDIENMHMMLKSNVVQDCGSVCVWWLASLASPGPVRVWAGWGCTHHRLSHQPAHTLRESYFTKTVAINQTLHHYVPVSLEELERSLCMWHDIENIAHDVEKYYCT